MSENISGRLVDERVEVISNERVAPSIYQMTLLAPQIASRVQPGQFIHLEIPNFEGHVLRRPFSVYMWDGERRAIRLLYQTVGSGSTQLTRARWGDATRAIGPVGRGWNPPASVRRAALVCGGMGVAPLTMLAEQLVSAGAKVDCLLGATTAERLVGEQILHELGAAVHVCTDDGTLGHAGFCTDLLPEFANDADYIAVCGPGPMEAAAVKAVEAARPGYADDPSFVFEVSMEKRMACGIGACLSCVVDTVEGKKRACVDGPVFNASEVVWR